MMTHHRVYRTQGRSLVMAQQLVQRGHHVTLIATSNDRRFGIQETLDDGVKIIEMPDLLWGRLRSGWDPWALINREWYILRLREKFDLVHCFETRPNSIYPALTLSRRQHIPLITDWNDWFGRGGLIEVLRPIWYRIFFGKFETYFEEAFRNKGDGLTVISHALAERAVRMQIPQEKIFYLPGGVTPESYPIRPVNECRKHMNYNQDIPILGFCSSDSYLDMEMVLESLAIIRKTMPETKLIITGRVRPSVIQAAKKFNVMDGLLMSGFLPNEELSWCLGSANVFMLPFPPTIYNIGRWPNKIGLYMALGRPVVTNDVGDVAQVFGDTPIGLLADPNAQHFADQTLKLLLNKDLANRLGENAYQMALSQYNWKNLIVGLEEFYYKILEKIGA